MEHVLPNDDVPNYCNAFSNQMIRLTASEGEQEELHVFCKKMKITRLGFV